MARDICEWLDGLGLGQYADAFADSDVDLDVLCELTDEDLKSLGVSLGHRKKILRCIKELSSPEETGATEAPKPRQEPASSPGNQGERRHLTVLFADMVGSTKLSSELDPEDYQSVIRAYQEACASAVARYDGYVAKYLGDGILAYFGYPRAHEDDAERAIRAARDVIAAVSALEPRPGLSLRTRAGIATGEVVVGEIIGEGTSEETTVAGETPNLAARLQAMARPDTVVISGRTRRLVEGRFTFENLGLQTVKGFAQPVEAVVVGEETAAQARYEAESQQGLSELVGRKEEVGLFMRRWDLVKEGDGQVILLSAEAGVGKSRILRAVQDRMQGEPFNQVLYFGSPFHQNSALYPVSDQLRRILQLDKHENEATILDHLEGVLDDLSLPAPDFVPYFASMLDTDASQRYEIPDLTPQDFRARTLEAIVAVIEKMSEQDPVLMVVEDAHWIDPTTLELLGTLVNRLRDKRVLLVIAFRPEFEAPWGREGNVTTCTLNHLSRKECAALVTHVAGGKPLPEDLVGQIVSRTDGIPLFVEELTKSILESGDLQDTGDSYEMRTALSSLAIPDSLQESLMARLDRLSPAKEVAQTGAVIGRQFPYELLSQVAELDEKRLDEALEDLVGSGLMFRHGVKPDAIFEFKHALIRDVSYESLLKSNRRRIHDRIADILEKALPRRGETEPELLAHHFEGGGKAEKAITYWHVAGQRGADHSAYQEAIAHCERGLVLVESLSDPDLRSKWELELQLVIGLSSMAIHGFSSPKVIAAYSRARDLAKQLDEPAKLFPATWGMWIHQQQSGQIGSARKTADELLQLSEQLGDAEFQLEAHHAAWTTCFRMGDFEQCRHHAEQGIALHNPDEHFALASRYAGHDAGICARNHAALSAWYLGYPDQAVDHDRGSAALTEMITHPLSKVHAKSFGAILYRHLGDPAGARTYAEGSLKLSRELGYLQYTAYAEVVHGWAIAQIREKDEGVAIMNKALGDLTDIGAWARCGTFLPCLADIHARSNETERALEAVERARDLIQKSGERTAETEILVLKGEVLERTNAPRADVEAALQAALDLARKDGVRAMELRAATALARVWRDTGRGQEALELLAPVYSLFTEGLETPDLQASRQILDELRGGS